MWISKGKKKCRYQGFLGSRSHLIHSPEQNTLEDEACWQNETPWKLISTSNVCLTVAYLSTAILTSLISLLLEPCHQPPPRSSLSQPPLQLRVAWQVPTVGPKRMIFKERFSFLMEQMQRGSFCHSSCLCCGPMKCEDLTMGGPREPKGKPRARSLSAGLTWSHNGGTPCFQIYWHMIVIKCPS